MNLDQTVNPNGDVDYNQIDENALRFILTLQSLTTVPEVWELFLRTIGQVFPEPLEEAHLAYKAGVLARALIARPVPGDDNKNNTQKNNKKKITWRELNVTDYPFVETGDKGDSESGFRCSGKEILLFKRTEMYFIQAKLIFSSTPPPFFATDFQEGFGAGAGAGENKLPRLSRIFFNQVVLLLRIEHLEFNSVKDDVTAAYNQKYLKGFIQNEIERCKRYPSFFSVVFFDLDNLKNINDTYGHLVGTEVLKEVASILRRQVRKSDLLSRFGGDEFVIVLLKANHQKAYETCGRIKRQLESTIFLKDKNLNITMTGCFGISGFPRDGCTAEELIKKADSAMYEMKRRGKNAIQIYEGA